MFTLSFFMDGGLATALRRKPAKILLYHTPKNLSSKIFCVFCTKKSPNFVLDLQKDQQYN